MSSPSLIEALDFAKFVFFVSYIAATIGVIIGVYWEGDQFDKAMQQRGWTLLVTSLALDTFFTILIFGTDGWIGHIQRNEIIALENRLAARSLSAAQSVALIERLKPFGGQEFDIVTYWKSPEALAFTNGIYDALIKSGWKYDKPASGEFLLGVQTGVLVWFDDRADAPVANAGKELVAALNASNFDAAVDDQPQTHAPNDPVTNKMIINVGIK